MQAAAPLVPPAVAQPARPLGRFGVAFSRRALALFALGLLWMIPAFADVRFVAAMFAWDAIVIVAWLVEFRRLPPPAQLTVERVWNGPATLSTTSRVEIRVRNDARQPLRVRVLDTTPARLRETPPVATIVVPARGEARTTYEIHPTRRGQTSVGGVYLKYLGGLQLAERWAAADIAQPVMTYPDLSEARRQSLYLVRSRQVEMERRSKRVRGSGRAFESLREQRPGDEIRDICWTASARRGKLVTRLYEVERSQTVWMLIDAGRLMRARTAGWSKLDYAVSGALALAQVALAGGDRVGVVAYGRRVSRLAAASGRAQLKRVLDHLAAVPEDEWEADHLLAASRVLAEQQRRSLVVWITDLAETASTPDVVKAATALMKRHLVLFVVIGEPDVQGLANRAVGSSDEMFETAAAQEIVQRRESLLARLRNGGALAVETAAAGLTLAVVNGYLDVKARGRL